MAWYDDDLKYPEGKRARGRAAAERRRQSTEKSRTSAQKIATELQKAYAEQKESGLHLTPEQIDGLMQLTAAEMHAWNLICQGRPPRNSREILSGIKLKLEYTRKKPDSQPAAGVAPVTVVINTIGPEPTVEVNPDPTSPEESVQ